MIFNRRIAIAFIASLRYANQLVLFFTINLLTINQRYYCLADTKSDSGAGPRNYSI